MTDLHVHTPCAEGVDQLVVAGDLRRNGDPPDRCEGQLGLYFGQQRGGAIAHMGPERLGESLRCRSEGSACSVFQRPA